MAPFILIELVYDENLFDNYHKLNNLPGFVLLESTDKTIGRYDILSAHPYHQFIIDNNNLNNETIFKELDKLIGKVDYGLDLPFQGGAIGYFSYDLAANLKGLPSNPQPSLKEIPLADIGFYDWAIITDHLKKKVFLFAANTRKETAAIVEEILALWQSHDVKSSTFKLAHGFTTLINKNEYRASFTKVYHYLEEGHSYQVNYSQPFNTSYKGDSFSLYGKIRTKNPVPFAAFMRTKSAEILSFSPERFLLINKDYLLSSPIKGTEKRAINKIEDSRLRQHLASSEKNRAENIMIVDLIRNDLGQLAVPGSVKVRGLCEIESYQSVHHLVSHIEAKKKENISNLEAFLACFPGGSITGAPKLEAMRIINEVEHFDRGIYCGSIGYFSSHGRADTSIAIRTITASKGILHLAAGGGIVVDSTWEEEYQECFTKITAIKHAIEL